MHYFTESNILTEGESNGTEENGHTESEDKMDGEEAVDISQTENGKNMDTDEGIVGEAATKSGDDKAGYDSAYSMCK